MWFVPYYFGVDNRKDFQIEMVGNKKTLPTLPGFLSFPFLVNPLMRLMAW